MIVFILITIIFKVFLMKVHIGNMTVSKLGEISNEVYLVKRIPETVLKSIDVNGKRF